MMVGQDRRLAVKTLSLQEVKQSFILAGLDVLLFFFSGVLARRYAMHTRSRILELQNRMVESDTLIFRALFLQLLALSNFCRAAGIIFDAFLRLVWSRHHKLAWRRWLDYLFSSLPTLIWLSMLSVLLLYVIEVYNRTQLKRMPLLRPTFAFGNAILFLLYATVAGLTLRLCGGPGGPTYTDFRRFEYFLLGCGHVILACGITAYGLALGCQLRRRKPISKPMASQVDLALPTERGKVLLVVLPLTELLRTFDDMEYSLGGLPFDLYSGLSSVLFLAGVKLFLEWVPSAAILWAFRPSAPIASQGSALLSSSSLLVDPLVPPGMSPAREPEGLDRFGLLPS